MIRTLPNDPGKRARDYTAQTPPYLSQEAAALLVSRLENRPEIETTLGASFDQLLEHHRAARKSPAAAEP